MLTKCLNSSRQFLPGLLDPGLLGRDLGLGHGHLAHQRLARVDEGRGVLVDGGEGGGLAAGRVLRDVEVGGDARQQLVVRDAGTRGPGYNKISYIDQLSSITQQGNQALQPLWVFANMSTQLFCSSILS